MELFTIYIYPANHYTFITQEYPRIDSPNTCSTKPVDGYIKLIVLSHSTIVIMLVCSGINETDQKKFAQLINSLDTHVPQTDLFNGRALKNYQIAVHIVLTWDNLCIDYPMALKFDQECLCIVREKG